MDLKTCRRCGQEKRAAEFGRDMSRPDLKNDRCRECIRSINKDKVSRRPPDYRVKQNAYMACRRRDMKWSAYLWSLIRDRFDSRSSKTNGGRFTIIRRGIPVDIDQSYIESLFDEQRGLCYISGIQLDTYEKRSSRFPSVDRIDASRGYVRGNVAIACRWVNYGKNKFSIAEMRENFALVRAVRAG